MTAIENRYDFTLIFEVTNGNPNGDPDAGNMPRMDPETGSGFVTDVCLKRKVRNFVEMAFEGEERMNIYVREGTVLNARHREAYAALRPDDAKVAGSPKLQPKDDAEAKALTAFMTENFFDIRTFGAVMGTKLNCGQVRGPVQMTFAHSVEPISPIEVSITRMAATNEGEKKERSVEEAEQGDERTENRTMGRKHIVPYGLYVAHGFISAHLARKSGFSEDDLKIFFDALVNMFDHDRSAARGEMATRKLVVFRHDSALGNAPAHRLFDRVRIGRNVGGAFQDIDTAPEGLAPARKFSDYKIEIDRNDLPAGIEILELV